MDSRIPVVVIEGATSTGKSEIAILLAEMLDGGIISADSMQIYRGLTIGTGKVVPAEMRGIPHYMLDVCDPGESFDVSRYVKMARGYLREVHERGMLPIVCGGTGFYIQALLKDLSFAEAPPDTAERERLLALAGKEGPEALHEMLRKIDPAYADSVHPNNVKRVIRALEYYGATGERLSDKNAAEKEKPSPYAAAVFHIVSDRGVLYERIEKRVDRMIGSGLADEVRSLLACGVKETAQSMQGLGYKELIPYLQGKCSLDDAVRVLKRDTRHYAKRQMTWFRSDREAVPVRREDHGDDPAAVAEYLAAEVQSRFRKGENGWEVK